MRHRFTLYGKKIRWVNECFMDVIGKYKEDKAISKNILMLTTMKIWGNTWKFIKTAIVGVSYQMRYIPNNNSIR